MTTLDELRRANLQEQRRKAEAAALQPATAEALAPPSSSPPKNSQARATKVEPSVVKPDVPVEEPVKSVQPPLNGNGNGSGTGHVTAESALPDVDEDPRVPEVPVAVADTVEPVSVDEIGAPDVDEASQKARAIMDRFYRGLAHKVVHPTGVKTTVDMPPDLFWRVKRYCHDHNNVTVRQLFLDLVIAVLEEEGY